MKRNMKGFTLIELLVVITILGLVLIIAVPKITNTMKISKKRTLEISAKSIAKSAEERYIENETYGINEEITCENVTNISRNDFSSCIISFDSKGNASVTIIGDGSYEGIYVCNGTKTDAEATSEECSGSSNNSNTGASYITSLLAEEETKHNGLVQTYATVNGEQVDAGIRYAGPLTGEGAVKNQVYFNCAPNDGTNAYESKNYDYANNCEIWRIIGVFNTKTDETDTTGASRIKIVRDQVLSTEMAWDKSGINQWGETTRSDGKTLYAGSSLKQYLNDEDESYYNSLTSIAKAQISDALWYTGAVTDDTASGVYEDERSTAISFGTTVTYTISWVGKIGLIYTSDFGYAGTNCGYYTILGYDSGSSCGKTRNWLTPSNGYYWTISPDSTNNAYYWGVGSAGYAYCDNVRSTYGVRPALYLSSNVQIIGGDGSEVPYKLK